MNLFIKKNKKYCLVAFFLTFLTPIFLQAASSTPPPTQSGQTVSDLIIKLSTYSQQATVFIVTLCMLLLAWGLFLIYFKKTDVDHAKGIKFIIGAVIALTAILSIWALVAILRASLGIDSSTSANSDEIRDLIPF